MAGSRRDRQALQRARQLRQNMTGPEQRLWSFLRNRKLGGLKFRRQAPIGPFVVDFLCVEEKLIVELDGASHTDRGAYDRDRQTSLEREGYTVLRLDNDDVLAKDIEPVLWAILKAAGRPIEGMGPSSRHAPSP